MLKIRTLREVTMTEDLAILVERAKPVKMTNQEKDQQRKSFAYGNTKIENDLITRAMVEKAAAKLNMENG